MVICFVFGCNLQPQQPEELLQLLSFPSQDRTQREALSGSTGFGDGGNHSRKA